MPDLSGNIPLHVFYGSIMAELLRIARASMLYKDFLSKARCLYTRMLNQGATVSKLSLVVNKLFNKHSDTLSKFNKSLDGVRKDVLK